MIDHCLDHEAHGASPAPDSARWLTCCVLLADPIRAGRALIAELNRLPTTNTRHGPSDVQPEGWPTASECDGWHEAQARPQKRSQTEQASEVDHEAIGAPGAATQGVEGTGGRQGVWTERIAARGGTSLSLPRYNATRS